MFDRTSLLSRFDFSKTESQAFVVHSVRLAFLVVVLAFTLSFQLLESRVEASHVFTPLYSLIGASFLLQVFFLSFFKSLYKKTLFVSFLFFFETFYITGLIYFIGVQQSLLIFLYLVNLILCGILFQRQGALLLALWTSILFSFIVSLDTGLTGNTAYLAVGVNNLAFFTVAYLSGYLSEQLNVMGEQLKEKVKDVEVLKNLNDLILKNMSSGLITIDSQQLILQSNPAAHYILGLGGEDMLRQPIVEFVPGLDLEDPIFDKEFDVVLRKSNEKRILRVNMSQLRDDQDRVQGSIVSFQDQTHLRTLEKRLRQSEKMAAIGQLAAGIAHEIRNPLAGISGSIQLLQGDNSDAEQSAKLMSIVNREIDRLNNLITEFLDFAKPEAPMEDQIDLSSLMDDVILFVKNDANQGALQIETHLQDGLLILGNRDKLRQAFLNIIVNGVQAMSASETPKMIVNAKKSGAFVIVSIKDQGVGIPDDLKERIFEPFHTTKSKGTGLGLAITHSIIEAHGAEIHVDSEMGVGTEFRLQFQSLHRD